MNKLSKNRVDKKISFGFTLIELVIALLILSLIAMIALPNYFEMKERGKQALVVENMKLVQLAVEAYAADFNGAYPTGPEPAPGFAYYFPGGDEEVQKTPGKYPKNPYYNIPMTKSDFLRGNYQKPGENRDESIGGPNDNYVPPGFIRYGIFRIPPGQNICCEYGIVGGDDNYRSIRVGGKIVVLHN